MLLFIRNKHRRHGMIGGKWPAAFWLNSFGGAGTVSNIGGAVDSDGNLYAVSTMLLAGYGEKQSLVITKYDSNGDLGWARLLDGTYAETGVDVAVDGSGNVYITGHTTSQGAGVNDIVVVKYNSGGDVLWQRALGGTNTDVGNSIAVDGSGNVYITGHTASQGVGGQDIVVVKYNSSGTVLWQRALGGTNNEVGNSIAVDGSGNVYVTGSTASQGAGGNDIVVVKYNSSGALQWQRALGGVQTDVGSDIAVDGSGNVYVTGSTASQGAGGNDIVVVKYNSSGTVLWQRALGAGNSDNGVNITIANDTIYVIANIGSGMPTRVGISGWDVSGNLVSHHQLSNATGNIFAGGVVPATTGIVYALGRVYTQDRYTYDGFVSKLSLLDVTLTSDDGLLIVEPADLTVTATTLVTTNTTLTQTTTTLGAFSTNLTSLELPVNVGVTVGQQITTAEADVYLYSVAVDGAGNVYVTGYTTSQGAGGSDIVVVKYNSSGTVLWQRALGGTNADVGSDIAVDGSGNVYIAGHTTSQGAGSNDIVVVKYNSSGTVLWQRALGGTNTEVGTSIAVDGSGNVYIAGYTASQGAGSNDIVVVKYNSSGALQWQRALGGTNVDDGRNIAVDGSGNVYIVGYTGSQGAGSFDIVVVKYNSSGTVLWQRALGGTKTEVGNSIAVDGSGNVYITGYTASQGAGSNDIVVVKYNSSGTVLWQRALGGTGSDGGNSITVDSASGNVIVCTDYAVVTYTPTGTLLRQHAILMSSARKVSIAGEHMYIVGYGSYGAVHRYGIGGDNLAQSKLTATNTTLTTTNTTLTATNTTLTATNTTLTSTDTTLTFGVLPLPVGLVTTNRRLLKS